MLRIHGNPQVAKHKVASVSKKIHTIYLKRRPKDLCTVYTYLLNYFADFFNNEGRLIGDKTELITII